MSSQTILNNGFATLTNDARPQLSADAESESSPESVGEQLGDW
jgi:hypothetical protein